MKARGIFFAGSSSEDRGELVEELCDALEAVLGPERNHELSDGQTADTLLRCLDLLVTTNKQKTRLKAFLDDLED